jgi:hypothetical protein
MDSLLLLVTLRRQGCLTESEFVEKPRPRLMPRRAGQHPLAQHQRRPRFQMDHTFHYQPVSPVCRQYVTRLNPQQSGQDRHSAGSEMPCQIACHQT